MTPQERMALIDSTLVIWDLLAGYGAEFGAEGNERAKELAQALRDHGDDLDDALVIRAVDKALRVSAHELATMGYTLRAAVAMGSDYGAAFAAGQVAAASEGNRKKGVRQRKKARALQAKGRKVSEIATDMGLTERRVYQLLRAE